VRVHRINDSFRSGVSCDDGSVMCCDAVAAAERNWYSDDEDENQQQKTAVEVKNDAQNPPMSAVNRQLLYMTYLLMAYWTAVWLSGNVVGHIIEVTLH